MSTPEFTTRRPPHAFVYITLPRLAAFVGFQPTPPTTSEPCDQAACVEDYCFETGESKGYKCKYTSAMMIKTAAEPLGHPQTVIVRRDDGGNRMYTKRWNTTFWSAMSSDCPLPQPMDCSRVLEEKSERETFRLACQSSDEPAP